MLEGKGQLTLFFDTCIKFEARAFECGPAAMPRRLPKGGVRSKPNVRGPKNFVSTAF